MKANILSILGLTKEEEQLYKALCMKPLQSIADITRTTKLHRPRVYQIISSLLKKEIIQERVIGKRTKYIPVEPVQLYDLLRTQQQSVGEVIDELQTTYETQAKKPDIDFYVGSSGYTALFDDIAAVVPKGGQVLRYSARRPDDEDFKTSSAYRTRRNKDHFERLAITSAVKGKRTKARRYNKFTKIIPANYDAFDDHVSQMIYEDRVVFTDHENETTFIIKSSKIAGVQKKLFKLLWKHLDEPK